MDEKSTEDALGVFWKGEEVDGATFYGFVQSENIAPPAALRGVWPSGFECEVTTMGGEGWTVWVLDVRVSQWPKPDRWVELVRETLGALKSEGAIAAWGAVEGYFVEPPELFKPERQHQGVWSILTRSGYFACPAKLGGRFLPVQAAEWGKMWMDSGIDGGEFG